jgi:tetratricopeptide (TPR) repeat protein
MLHRLGSVAALIWLAGCAARQTPASPAVPRTVDVQERFAAAADLLRAGCFDCLSEALREYEAVRDLPNVSPAAVDTATLGIVQAAGLLDLRSRELGMVDGGYLQRARDALGSRHEVDTALAFTLAAIDTIPPRFPRAGDQGSPEATQRMRAFRQNLPALIEERRAQADADPLSAYTWLAFECTHNPRAEHSEQSLLEPVPRFADTSLVAYRVMVCLGSPAEALAGFLLREPRFVEVNYLLGMAAYGRLRVDEAERPLLDAYEWRPRWPAVTNALGTLYFSWEEFPRALELYEETLAAAPDNPDALLGRVKALSYLGKHSDAFAAIDAILAGTTAVFQGEAYFWRAWNHAQAGGIENAWVAIQQAHKLWVNSEVLKLGGIIAYHRQDLDVARQRFEESRKLNPTDCEVLFNLGNVHADQRSWTPVIETFVATVSCLDAARASLANEIAAIEASAADPARKARLIARRRDQIATAQRLTTQSLFNSAAASFNLGRRDEARKYAELVADDERFGERARELLGRLK